MLTKCRSRGKFFKAFKKPRLHINKELYKSANKNTHNLIETKKQAFFDENLLGNI